MSESARSRIVAARYGISAKSVRDIWNRKSWIAATEPLWTDEVHRSHCLRLLCIRCREYFQTIIFGRIVLW